MPKGLVRLLRTPNHHGYSVKFDPFNPNLLAVATGQNFGLTGSGKLILKDCNATGDGTVCNCIWTDGLFDLAWSEESANHIVTASGDGSLQLWDTSKPQAPIMVYREHTKEAYSVDWSQTRDEQLFISASWDATIKLWDPKCEKSLVTLMGHENLIYQAVWSPHLSGCVASVSGDGTLRIWNVQKHNKPSMTLRACNGEVLCCDWCKYDKNIIATGGTDGVINGWDLRQPSQPVYRLMGHEYPVRRLKFSPFMESQLASVSYDFTTRLWDYKLPAPCLEQHQNHTEFVYGLDFSNHVQGLMADCAWDQTVGIYNFGPPPQSSSEGH